MQIDFHEAFLPSYIPLALVNLCLAEKIREDMIFSGLNLELADLKQHQPLSYSEMNILVENCLNALTFSPLSLKVAHSLDLEHMGALGQALINCPSFKEAQHCLERYCVLIDPALWFKTEQCPQHIVLRFRKMIPLGQIYQYSQEVIAVSVLRLCSMLFQPADVRLDFEFSRPAYARQFNTLPCQIQWQQSETRLIFPIKALACAGSSAHQQRFHEAVQQCEKEFQSFYKQQKCWIFRVLSLIHSHINSPLSAEAMAKMLYISRSTFFRKLQQHQTHYEELVHAVRMNVAEQYLKQNKGSIQELSEHLGFSHASNFIKAFQQHFGATPRHWQKHQNAF
ncbi:helix-turn-helix transcriptional regulator [Acinetobacter bouvetii]|uniref:HTH-type transcriptional regulator AppY n=1 Tax=Acinetobacter bouvetii TaxID=202951 RepID=A0A811G7Y0_9GAMM|nr:AraC family transcriptional regulator [Acinetobacter bouvetii]CAB1211655.1 HTH-type transcriptional regulator AppY [Acinetobacter bouvetii]